MRSGYALVLVDQFAHVLGLACNPGRRATTRDHPDRRYAPGAGGNRHQGADTDSRCAKRNAQCNHLISLHVADIAGDSDTHRGETHQCNPLILR